MPKITLVVREVGRLKPDYSLQFEVPEIPRKGDYISVTRPDNAPWTEDFLVRQVWWNLHHENTGGYGTKDDRPGTVTDIVVEVDQAIGPLSYDKWRDGLEAKRGHGTDIPEFEVERLSIRQDAMKK